MRLLLVVWIFLFGYALAEEPIPFVFWSMDKIDGTKIIPENNTDSKFQGDFRDLSSDPSDVFVAGVVGDALLVKKDSFDLAESIKGSDCIRTPDACTSGGLSFAFWLNVQKWNSASFQVFFRTTTSTRTTPGVYFGKGDDESLLAYFRDQTGDYYETTFPQSYFWNTWSHLAIVWSEDGEPAIYVNGSVISSSTVSSNAGSKRATVTDFVIGSSLAPDFKLDEFKVFYHNLSALEAMDVFMGDLHKETIFSSTSTTTSTTTTPTTISSTTTTPTTTSSTTTKTTTTPTTTIRSTTSHRPDNVKTTAMANTGNTTPTTTDIPPTTPTAMTNNTQTTATESHWKPKVLLGILIPLLVGMVAAIVCVLFFCCCRDRNKSKKRKDQPVRYTEVRTADSDAPLSSNPATDVDTDAENERQKPLIHPV